MFVFVASLVQKGTKSNNDIFCNVASGTSCICPGYSLRGSTQRTCWLDLPGGVNYYITGKNTELLRGSKSGFTDS